MRFAPRPAAKPLALAIALLGAAPAFALQFEMNNGLKANVDTTVSYGISVRTDKRDPALIGIANGGTSRSVNEDDGDLNFDSSKPFANIVKATMDAEIKWRNFGFFGRGSAYYDFDLHDSNKLGPVGRKRLGKDVVGLDGFFSAQFDLGGRNLNLRLGRQVISWGESTFIANGINVVSAVDLSKLRVPGSELKEAFIPAMGLWASQQITDAATLEGFVLTNHDKIRLDPKGSYFSNNDFASPDATRVILGFGRRRDQHFAPSNPIPPTTPTAGPIAAALYGPFDFAASVWAPKSDERPASDNGQYGLALRYLAKGMKNTELGVYFMNYHSRVPLFSGMTGSVTSSASATSILTGGPLNSVHNGTATYFAEYPEDIRLFGVSFNTQGPLGIALQGEYAYRPNLPLQYATPELLLASLGVPNLVTGFVQIPGAPTGATSAALYPARSYLRGWERVKASQFQMTGTKSWPSVMGAEQAVVVSEVGFNWFHNLPSGKKFNGPAVFLPATAFGAALAANNAIQTDGFLTEFSWGYRMVGRLEYANALASGTLAPRLAFTHDVKGVGPNFNQSVKSASLGMTWDYQRKWIVDMQFTSYFGGRTFCGTDTPATAVPPTQSASWCSSANPLKDRDFYSLSVSYSF